MDYNNAFIEPNLPNPLTPEQTLSYFKKYKEEDMEAREQLINHNIKLVISRVYRRFSRTSYDIEELVSVGIIGLIKSVDTFDLEKEASFANYASTCIDNEILMFIRKYKKTNKDISLSTPIGEDELTLEDRLEDTDSDFVLDYEKKIIYEEIRKIIRTLPENKNKKIIMLYFGFSDGRQHTQREISEQLNFSRPYVSRIISKEVNKIKRRLIDNGTIEMLEKKKGESVTSSIKPIEKVEEKGSEHNMGLKTPSIYKYFGTYTKEQINQMILKLSEEERAQLTLKYGDDLENPVRNPNWNQKLNAKFYRTLIPKMKSLLDNLVDKQERKQSHDASILEKEDYIKMLEMLRTPSFEQLMTSLSPKEAIVISLRLGYVDEKYFSTESISNFLGIEQEEVREITKKVLLTYKENINQFIDKAIGNVTDKPVILNKK